MNLLRLTYISLVAFALASCTTVQTHDFGGAGIINNSYQSPGQQAASNTIQILYSEPKKDFESIGTFSVRKYKPGFSDPTVTDALPELRSAAGRLGADAVIIRSTKSNETRFITIEGEAIKWLSR